MLNNKLNGFSKFNFSAAIIAALFAVLSAAVFSAPAYAKSQAEIEIENDILIYDYKAAAAKCRKLSAGSEAMTAGLLLSRALHLSGDTDGAMSNYADLLYKFAEEPAVYIAAAQYAASQIKFSEAKKIYSAALGAFASKSDLYSRRGGEIDSLFNSALAFYDKMNYRSQEVELYKTAALNIYGAAPKYFNRALAYFIDNKQYDEALELIKTLEAKDESAKLLIAEAKISVYEKMISGGEKNSEILSGLSAIYEKILLDKQTGEDKLVFTYTAYFNFLKNNSLLDDKIGKLKAGFDSSKEALSDLLLINLLMQNSGVSGAREYINKFIARQKEFGAFISVSRIYRHYGEMLAAMKMSLGAMELAAGDGERETLYYEMASNLSKFYFIDLRYLIFKNAAVDLFEQRCDDLAVNLLMISSSRRFMRSNYDALRVALRQYISRSGAIYYYNALLEFKNSPARAKYMNELASLYRDIAMDELSYKTYENLCRELPESPYASGALKNMVRHYQKTLAPQAAAIKSAAAIDAYAKLSETNGFARAKSALAQLITPEASDFYPDKNAAYLYYQALYDFLAKNSETAADKKWVESNMLSLLNKLNIDKHKRIEIIDGMLKKSPYDRALLKAKENLLLAQLSTDGGSLFSKKSLENFYAANYFADGDFMDKYLQFLNREFKIESVIEELKKPAASGGAPPRMVKLLAECCFFISDFEQAEKWFDEFIKTAPADTASLMKLANLKRSFNKSDEAVKLLQRLIAVEPSSKNAYVTAGDITALDKDKTWEAADNFFSKITAIDPENNDNYIELATIYWDYFKYEEGLDVLSKRRIEAGSDFIFGREIANLFEINGSVEVAIPEYISVICAPDEHTRDKSYRDFEGEENESSERGSGGAYRDYNYRYERPETADVIECRARLVTLYKKEKFKKLIDESFEKFIERSPLNYKLYYEYSKLLIEFGMGERAFDIIKKSYPAVDRGYYFVQLANLLERIKKISEAKLLYYRAIEAGPEINVTYADALDFFKRFAMEEDYAKTLKMRADKFTADRYYMEEYYKYMMELKGAENNSNFKEAAQALDKLIAEFPLKVSYRNQYADVIIKLEGIKAASAYIEGVIKASETEKDKKKKFHIDDIVRLKETLARLLAKDRRVDEALEVRRELIYDNPAEPGFAETLAQIASSYNCADKVNAFITSLDEKKMKPANKIFLSARYFARLNLFEEAAGCYKKLAALNPNDAAVVTNYFTLCLKNRRLDEAKKLVARYLQLAAAAGGETERQAFEDCSLLHIQSGDTKEAMTVFDGYLDKLLKNFKFDENSYNYYSYQYVNELNWMVKKLESVSDYSSAISYLDKKLAHLSMSARNNNYLIDETNEKIAALYEKNGQADKAVAYISAVAQNYVNSGSMGSIPDSLLKRLISLWKTTSSYQLNIKEYKTMLDNASRYKDLDQAQVDVLRFLLRIYRMNSEHANFIALVKKLETSGSNLNYAIEISENRPEFEKDYIDLMLKRINLTVQGGASGAPAAADMIKLGALMAKNNNQQLASDFFGTALKYGRYNDTLKSIAEKLLEKGSPKMAASYYSAFLNKCSPRAYYLNAPEIARLLAEKELYGEALDIAEILMEKYGEDTAIMLGCAALYKNAFNKTAAVEIYKKAALKAVNVEQARQAVSELETLMGGGEFLALVDEMIELKKKNGFSLDYSFLLNIKGALLFKKALYADCAAFDELNSYFMSLKPPAEIFIQYAGAILSAAPGAHYEICGDSPGPEITRGALKRYIGYCRYFAEKINALDDIFAADAAYILGQMINNLPWRAAYKDGPADIIALLKPKTSAVQPSFIYDLSAARIDFDSRENELFDLFKQRCTADIPSFVQAARLFIDNKDYKAAALFANTAAAIDTDDHIVRLVQIETLCGLKQYDRAAALAGAVDIAKLRPPEEGQYGYYNDDYFSYGHIQNMLRFAGCLYELKKYSQAMSAAAAIMTKSRSYYEYEDSYQLNNEYQSAAELYFKSAVSREERLKLKTELYNAAEDYITDMPRYGGVNFENKNIISRLARILYSWDGDIDFKAFTDKLNPGPARDYIKIYGLAQRGESLKAAASSAIDNYKSNYYLMDLLGSMADDIDDTGLVRKIFSALATLEPAKKDLYDREYMRYYCADILNDKK
jgi:tetratricopeptide (TPR) repeat protein